VIDRSLNPIRTRRDATVSSATACESASTVRANSSWSWESVVWRPNRVATSHVSHGAVKGDATRRSSHDATSFRTMRSSDIALASWAPGFFRGERGDRRGRKLRRCQSVTHKTTRTSHMHSNYHVRSARAAPTHGCIAVDLTVDRYVNVAPRPE